MPLKKRQRAEQADTNVTAAAQGAADSGHLGGCMKQILNAFPQVLFTPDNIAMMRGLFPDKMLGVVGMDTRRKHKAKPGKKDEHNLDYSKGEILCYLSNVKKGKGAGSLQTPPIASGTWTFSHMARAAKHRTFTTWHTMVCNYS
jgi:hypothetical protein